VAIAIKVATLVLIGLDLATLWIAVLADVGSSLLVVCHSLTILKFETGGCMRSSAVQGEEGKL
jgi:cation transport ATPase